MQMQFLIPLQASNNVGKWIFSLKSSKQIAWKAARKFWKFEGMNLKSQWVLTGWMSLIKGTWTWNHLDRLHWIPPRLYEKSWSQNPGGPRTFQGTPSRPSKFLRGFDSWTLEVFSEFLDRFQVCRVFLREERLQILCRISEVFVSTFPYVAVVAWSNL